MCCSVLALSCGVLSGCAAHQEPEESTPLIPEHQEVLVILGNLHPEQGGFARLEFLLSFADERGAVWFRSHKNDYAMVLLETLSMERFPDLQTKAGQERFLGRLTEQANQELLKVAGTAQIRTWELR